MTNILYLGPVPNDEPCEQLGEGYSLRQARKECRAYINQLVRMFGNPPKGTQFRIKSEFHDFGNYLEVVLEYHESDEVNSMLEFALNVEGKTPSHWDEEARKELGL